MEYKDISTLNGECLFFFRFYVKGVCARERRATARPEKKKETTTFFLCLSRLAPSVTRGVVSVSRAFCLMHQEKRETARSLCLQKIAINISGMRDLNERYVSFVYQVGGVIKK